MAQQLRTCATLRQGMVPAFNPSRGTWLSEFQANQDYIGRPSCGGTVRGVLNEVIMQASQALDFSNSCFVSQVLEWQAYLYI